MKRGLWFWLKLGVLAPWWLLIALLTPYGLSADHGAIRISWRDVRPLDEMEAELELRRARPDDGGFL